MAAQQQARCIFCDDTGLTKVHVFAQSWTKFFEDPSDDQQYEVVYDFTDPETGERTELNRAKTFAMKRRCACGPRCNSGWLRDLEERVASLMAGFAAGTPAKLDADEQTALALWASSASLIAMSDAPEGGRFAAPALAREVYAEQRPAEGMQVWIGANTHGQMGGFNSHSLTDLRRAGPGGAWGASIAFGYAIFHLVYHGRNDERMQLRGTTRKTLRRIWTPRDKVAWPPPVSLPHRDLRPLAASVAEGAVFERAARTT